MITHLCYDQSYYSRYEGRSLGFYSDLLATVIKEGDPGPILDLGCGLGHFVELGARWGLDVHGLDGSEYAILAARERCSNLNAVHHDLADPLPFSSESFDNVVLFQVIAHLETDVAMHVVSEAHRVLRPRGVLFVYSPSRRNRSIRRKDHTICNPLSPSELRMLLEKANFEVLAEPNHGPSFNVPVFGKVLAKLTSTTVGSRFSHTSNAIARKATRRLH